MIPKKLLILDLDETLIFAAERPLVRAADFHVGPYHVYRRPGLADFLNVCFELFDVAVWTSSSPLYAEEAVRAVFPDPSRLAFVWASDRCTRTYDPETGEHYSQKNLKKIKWRQSYGNLVRVAPYLGAEEDAELSPLASYLYFLEGQPDVRAVEKRQWRRHASHMGTYPATRRGVSPNRVQ